MPATIGIQVCSISKYKISVVFDEKSSSSIAVISKTSENFEVRFWIKYNSFFSRLLHCYVIVTSFGNFQFLIPKSLKFPNLKKLYRRPIVEIFETPTHCVGNFDITENLVDISAHAMCRRLKFEKWLIFMPI